MSDIDWTRIKLDSSLLYDASTARILAHKYIEEFQIKQNHFAGCTFIHANPTRQETYIASALDTDGLHFSNTSDRWKGIYLLDALLEKNKYVIHTCCKDNIYLKLERMFLAKEVTCP